MKRSAVLLWVVLFFPAAAGLLFSQDPAADPNAPAKEEDDTQEKPDKKETLEKLKQEGIKDPVLADPELLVEFYKPHFLKWPHRKESDDAVKQVIKGGKATAPYLIRLLDGRDYRLKPAVAHILGKLGADEARDRIESLINDTRLNSSLRHLLMALDDLDSTYTKALCMNLLSSSKRVQRNAAFWLLNSHEKPPARSLLINLLGSSEGDVRYKTFRLMEKNPSEELDEAALGLVGDPFPQLAYRITDYLGSRNNPLVVSGLKERLSFEPERGFAFALAALVKLETTFDEPFFEREMLADIGSFVSNRDPLFRTSAAAAMCCICLRSGNEEDMNTIHNRIVPAIMEVFLKNRYFKDFKCMLEISAPCMQKMTGAPFGLDLTFWREWWNTEGREFVEGQFLITVDATQYSRIVILISSIGKDGKRRCFFVAGDELVGKPLSETNTRAVFLSVQDMGSLLDLFYARGFFELPSKRSIANGDASPARFIEMRLEKRTRILMPDVERDADAYRAMEECLLEVYSDNLWQLLHAREGDNKWWENRYERWKNETDETLLTERFLSDMIVSMNDMPDEVLIECMQELARKEGLPKVLGEPEVEMLLSKLESRHTIDHVVEKAIDLIITAGEARLLESMIRFLYSTYERESYPLLGKAMRAFDCIDACLDDERWFVRAAAAHATPGTGPDPAPMLEPLLMDGRPEVRQAALCALAKTNSKASRALLDEVLNLGDAVSGSAVLKAISGINDPWVVPFFDKALKEGGQGLYNQALQGIAQVRSPQAAEVVKEFISSPGLSDEHHRAGIKALERIGGQNARDALFGFLEKCENEEMQMEIISGLARLGETRVFSRIAECLMEEKLRDRAIFAMAHLLVRDFGEQTWKYRELWNEHAGESQAYFLTSVLRAEEPWTADTETYCFEGIPVSTLVEALRHDQWPVRLAALRILEEGSGCFFGEMTRTSTDSEVSRMADAWEGWIEGKE